MYNFKTSYIVTSALALMSALTTTSCDDFLESAPDSRIEVDSEAKVLALLNSAYPQASYIRLAELSSDNVDDWNGDDNGNYDHFAQQIYNWEDIYESDNQSPTMVWQDFYAAIAAANHAIAAIDQLPASSTMQAARGEALLCRAYSHFILVNLFAQHYSAQHAATDPGIPYTTAPETTLNPSYTRQSVAEVYQLIEKDLLEGLSLMNEAIYKVPRYHFNNQAAYTFASRFYLFYQKPDEVIKYATLALGDNPAELLRDYSKFDELPTNGPWERARQYTSATERANFLISAVHSTDWQYFGPFSYGGRYNFNGQIAQKEVVFCSPWSTDDEIQDQFRMYIFYLANPNKLHFPKLPYYFEEVDANQHTGYYRSVNVIFKAEEALLNRAEAYILKDQNQLALQDMNLWSGNFFIDSLYYNTGDIDWSAVDWDKWGTPDFEYPYIWKTTYAHNQLDLQSVSNWCQKYSYYQPANATPLKHLNPDFVQLTERSDKENMLQVLLEARRLEFLQEGMRWFDVKRYGMTIYRRVVDASRGSWDIRYQVTDSLGYRDPRAALQLPFEALSAGLAGNREGLQKPSITPEQGNAYSSWVRLQTIDDAPAE